ncbi:MAG: hypothetical protein AB7M12_10995 [Hyphomonadaceae bacterium]
MPELLTKFSDAALTVLKSAGMRCGEGAPQTILTQCPAERFCAAPGGEICVYGLPQIAAMTRMTGADLAGASGRAEPATLLGLSLTDGLFLAAALIAGFALGRVRKRAL